MQFNQKDLDKLNKVKNLEAVLIFGSYVKNPNKARSLIYMFAMNNQINFHQENGAGYQFTADRIIDLDSINPQVAARLSSCFNHWKKYDTTRQALMTKELKRILAIKTLSKNVYEIISNALA